MANNIQKIADIFPHGGEAADEEQLGAFLGQVFQFEATKNAVWRLRDAVPVTGNGRECVIVRRDIYERTRTLSEERDVLAMQPWLADLAPDDWEDAANYPVR